MPFQGFLDTGRQDRGFVGYLVTRGESGMQVYLHILPGYCIWVKEPRDCISKGETDEKRASSKKVFSVAGFIAATGISPFP